METSLQFWSTFFPCSNYLGLNSDRFHVIPNPVSVSSISATSSSKLLDSITQSYLNCNNTILLSVGRLHPQKNHHMLLRSFEIVHSQNSNVRLVIVGQGPLHDILLKYINSNNLAGLVNIVPFNNNISAYYANANLFVHTSDYEGFGNVLVEALNFGLPICATDCPGSPSWLLSNGQYGKLAKVNSPSDFSKIVLDSISRPPSLTERNSLKAYSHEFSSEKIADRYLNYCLSICHSIP